ncbi:PAC2 family protein, partial [bacterium]|nr:PAC2 family protein [bacterium]
ISASCLMATMPHHVVQMPNPKASRGIVNVLASLLDLHIDLAEMDEAVEEMGKVLEEIEEKIRSAFSSMEGEGVEPPEELGDVDEEAAPQKVMEKIERMFLQVSHSTSSQQSKAMAAQLKQELDKWNLYGVYEDRFLNLFRDQ